MAMRIESPCSLKFVIVDRNGREIEIGNKMAKRFARVTAIIGMQIT